MTELNELLRRDAKAFAPTLAKLAVERGLAVTGKQGEIKPIPITATPIVLSQREMAHRVKLAAQMSSATFKMARAVLAGTARDLIHGALSPLERTLADKTFAKIQRLATVRVDFFVADGEAKALEVNATIPAMQGYSDIAARSFIEVVGRHAGLPDRRIAELWAKNGSNALALYRALMDGYAAERPGKQPNRVAILCRRHDAQITELRYLAERFSELGTEAEIVHPDELSGDDEVRAHGKQFDMVYRHLFIRRLEENPSPYVVELLGEVPNRRAVLLNPPASQVEVKAAFALLSQAQAEPDLARAAGLTDDELEGIAQGVPWTRPFRHIATTDPDGRQVADLVARVAEEPKRFVIKRSWDYGGRAVFLGSALDEPGFDERVRAAYGRSMGWAELCQRAAEDRVGGGFVVQELVRAQAEEHLLCGASGVDPVDVYVDFSAYASVGLERQPAWGGVCRGSISRIVNILGGGGVLPLITEEVASALETALKAR